MQSLLQIWPFIIILLNVWLGAAFIKNPYGVGIRTGIGKIKWYQIVSMLFLLNAVQIIFTISLFSNASSPTPVYTRYSLIWSSFLPLIIVMSSTLGKNRIISPQNLANFLLFRSYNSAQQSTPVGQQFGGVTTQGRYPFFAVGIVALSIAGITGSLIFAELQTCNTLDIWFGRSGCVGEVVESSKGIEIVSYSPDGLHLAIGGSDSLLHIVNPHTLDQRQDLSGVGTWSDAAAFSPDSSLMASASWDGVVRIWRVADGALLRKLTIVRNHSVRDVDLAFSPDDNLLAAGSGNAGIKVWRVSDGALVETLATPDYFVAFTPDGKQLVSKSIDGKNNIVFWNLADWSIGQTLPIQAGVLALIKNGSQIVTRNKNGVQVWDIASQKLLQQFSSELSAIAISTDGQTLAGSRIDEFTHVEVWDISSGKLVKSWVVSAHDEVNSTSFSPDGKSLAVANSFQLVQIWKIVS